MEKPDKICPTCHQMIQPKSNGRICWDCKEPIRRNERWHIGRDSRVYHNSCSGTIPSSEALIRVMDGIAAGVKPMLALPALTIREVDPAPVPPKMASGVSVSRIPPSAKMAKARAAAASGRPKNVTLAEIRSMATAAYRVSTDGLYKFEDGPADTENPADHQLA
jgi:hypothetical protein